MTVRQIESPVIELPCQIEIMKRRRKGTELSSCPSIGEEKREEEDSSDLVVQEVFVRTDKAEELFNTPQFESVTKRTADTGKSLVAIMDDSKDNTDEYGIKNAIDTTPS